MIVLARKHDFALEVCNITGGKDDSSFTLQTACVLKLPSITPRARVRLHLRNRTPLAVNSSELPALQSSRLPFQSSSADAMLGFDLHLRRAGHVDRRYDFWVHHSLFRKYAAGAVRSSCRASMPAGDSRTVRGFVSRLVKRVDHAFTSVPIRQWDEWGPNSTRWRESGDRQSLAGTRCAIALPGSLLLMDFNPGRLAKLRAQGSKDPNLTTVVDPTVIPAGRYFRQDITSRLPYCASVNMDIKNRVLMDDEWVLQIEVSVVNVLWPIMIHGRRPRSQEEGLFGWEGNIDFHSIIRSECCTEKHNK